MIKQPLFFIAALLFIVCIGSVPDITHGDTMGLKTSLKRYAVYTYKDFTILCEPYSVAENDWLYKIFRKKGEISEKDFPLFINIFKSFNPKVSNTDAIHPGQQILIPLKKIDENDYQEIEPGVVDVPVIELSSIPELVKPFITRRQIKKGDSVSELLDPVFRNPDGSLNAKGKKAFQIANPSNTNPDLIIEDSFVNIPSPSLASQPWFHSLFSDLVLVFNI